jgi:NCAIR mutase (PurE)-related protein
MEPQYLRDLLNSVQSGQTSVEAAMERLKTLSFEPLAGMANLDHHRELRTGLPEVILAQGKTPAQVAGIFQRLAAASGRALATRVQPDVYAQIQDQLPEGTLYHEVGRLLYLDREANRPRKAGIVVVSGGTSDMPVAEEAAISAEWMGNGVERVYDVGVAGLHRLLHHLPTLRRAHVIIVVAGMEGALPSVVGGLVSCPVIGVPTSVGYGASLGGLAALLAMLNSCASGVAVMNIDNGFGAACLAAKINRLGEAAIATASRGVGGTPPRHQLGEDSHESTSD